ncbi:MAG: hypothetical protein JNK29_14325 [Anaerolineales bacterium]|nr:hypothetical protein [Anaerolineales bacterium]
MARPRSGTPTTLEAYFSGQPESLALFEAVRALIAEIGPAALRVTKSQIAFRRRTAFAWVWRPGLYLRGRGAPLVLTLSFRYRHPSPRWKQIVEAAPRRFTHHLEVHTAADLDLEVRQWLRDAWAAAA